MRRFARLLHAAAPTVAVGLGGAVGATGRYLLGRAWNGSGASGFPWGTLAANVLGCLLIGVLMVLILDVWVGHRLLRPFLGIGVLGGFTTFSAYAGETLTLIEGGRVPLAVGYAAGTILLALLAVWAGAHTTRLILRTGGAR